MKKTLILCNGNPPSEDLFHKYRANSDYLIAADGGGNIALQFNTKPDVIIGDLDSFEQNKTDSLELIFEPNQEANDLEKALKLALHKQATDVHILGATGLRLDHTLKNLSVLKQFHNQFETLRMRDNYGEIRLLDPTFEEEFAIGTQLSLFPLSGSVSGITTRGLKYSLENESLTNGVRDGSSNEVIENPVRITYQKGDLLLFEAQQL